jgi:hypothetical protein
MALRFLVLKMITSEAEQRRDRAAETGDEGEDDGLALPARNVQYANAGGPRGDFQAWKRITIAIDTIRNFYPRAGGRNGSRIMMKSGVNYIVVNEHDEIVDAISSNDTPSSPAIVDLAAPPEEPSF